MATSRFSVRRAMRPHDFGRDDEIWDRTQLTCLTEREAGSGLVECQGEVADTLVVADEEGQVVRPGARGPLFEGGDDRVG